MTSMHLNMYLHDIVLNMESLVHLSPVKGHVSEGLLDMVQDGARAEKDTYFTSIM